MNGRIIVDYLVFFIATSVLASIVLHKLSKEARIKEQFIILFIHIRFFVSVLKTVLGEGRKNIIESFSENTLVTYEHYAIPLVVLAILLPIVIYQLCRKIPKTYDCLLDASSLCLSVCIIILLVTGNITNCVVVICYVVSLCICTFFYATKRNDSVRNAHDRELRMQTICVLLAWAVSVVIYIPGRLYLTNPAELHIAWYYYFSTLIVGAILIVLVCYSVICSITGKQLLQYFNVTVFGFTFFGYVQENFLNGKLIRMDGNYQNWDKSLVCSNLFIWIIGFIGIFLLSVLLKRKQNTRIIRTAALYLVVVQLIALTWLALTSEKEDNIQILTKRGLFDLSDKHNTIVFVLDWYDEQILDRIVEQEPDFLDKFDDFTWYKNQTSRYAFTDMSIPYMLTGIRWQEGMNEAEYADYAFEKSDLLENIAEHNFNIGIYTDSNVVRDPDGCISNYDYARGKCKMLETITMMSECSRYEMAPFVFKQFFHYSSGDMKEMIDSDEMYMVSNYDFYSTMQQNEFTVNGNWNGAFRFYHINGCHDQDIDEHINPVPSDIYSCGRGTIEIVKYFIEKLKKANLYDCSTIIVTADHGQNYLNDDAGRERRNLERNTSSPILLIKNRNESETMRVSEAPVSHDDFCATIACDVNGVRVEKYGRTYYDIGEQEERLREMDYYRSGDIPYVRYIINGLVTDEQSWSTE